MSNDGERDLIQRIRNGDEAAWQRLIAEYEGRLTAFVLSRSQERTQAEDLVQETFLGFLTSLPHYDETASLESFLFAIAAHKLTDALRRQGRRPWLSGAADGGGEEPGMADRRARRASSLARNREQQREEEHLIAACLRNLIQNWQQHGELERLKCAELLLVKGWSNKEVAGKLGISEQAVANHKQFVLGKLKIAANETVRGV